MFYTPYQYIDPSNPASNDSYQKPDSIFLKNNNLRFPSYESTVNISNSILYALEQNISDHACIENMTEILLSSQNTDINSNHFGLFPYFVSQCAADYIEPDYNFQPLALLPLLECCIEFHNLLPDSLTTRLSEAIVLTANVISYNSNLIDAQNKILEIILLVCVGEYFSISQFIHSAINRANKYYYLLKSNGDMPPEYNSPHLIILGLEAITHFSALINNEDMQKVLNEIKDILFSIFYRHFNPHLMQWTGPFSLFSQKFMSDDFFERIKKLAYRENSSGMTIPNKFRNFSPINEDKFEQLLVSRGFLFPHYKHYLVATLYNTKTFSLCSFNHDDLWRGRGPCVGYFGSSDSPYCLYVQALLNGFPFSSGAFHSIQYKEFLLGHINFSTDRGYKGISIDKSDIYKTTDFRIRFCIEGDIGKLDIAQSKNKIDISHKKIRIIFECLYAAFDGKKIKYECTKQRNYIYFDIVLYNGKEIDLELAKVTNAITAFSLFVGDKTDFRRKTAEMYEDKEFLYTSIHVDNTEIKLKSHIKPNSYEVIFSQDKQYIGGTEVAMYIDKIDTFATHHSFFFEHSVSLEQNFINENNIHNKKILRKISNITKYQLYEIPSKLEGIFSALNAFSINETKHYSILILRQLYALASRTDSRFIKIIERKYSDVYNQLNTEMDRNRIQRIILKTANKLVYDYKHLQTANQTNINVIIEEIVSTLNSEYTNPNLSLKSITSKYGISESYISRIFPEYMGISYVKYLTQLRVNKAMYLLKNSADVEKISQQCGYYNSQTFSTAFKKITGVTPKSFIKTLSSKK